MNWTKEAPPGTVSRDGERWCLTYVRVFPQSIEAVWAAITESEHLRHWLPADVVGERRVGAMLSLPFWPDTVEKYELDPTPMAGEVLAWEPPHVFAWTWDVDTLRFALASTALGTEMTFRTWLGATQADADTAAGYHVCLDLLALRLNGGAGSTAAVDPEPLRIGYEAAFADAE